MEIRDFAMDFFGLRGKNAIVTGGNTGLGQAFALALAKGGANVFVPSIVDDEGTTREIVEAEGVRYVFLQADITAPATPRLVVDTCVDRLGSVDILVNSAGICPVAEVLDFGRSEWDATVAVNLTAAFEMSFEAAQRMVPQRSGKIINICSVFTFLGGRLSPAYAASKHGIAGLTKAYCDELAPAQHPGQRHRPGLLRDHDHRGHEEQPGDEQARPGAHPRRPLGRPCRPDGGRGLPREPRLGLRQRARPLGGRRLSRPVGRGTGTTARCRART